MAWNECFDECAQSEVTLHTDMNKTQAAEAPPKLNVNINSTLSQWHHIQSEELICNAKLVQPFIVQADLSSCLWSTRIFVHQSLCDTFKPNQCDHQVVFVSKL